MSASNSPTSAACPSSGLSGKCGINSKIRECYKKESEENAKLAPRILLVGPSGVGKSTLVNTVFGFGPKEQAMVRAGGKPCTDNFYEYGPLERIPVSIIDSKGVEKEISELQRTEILKYVSEKNNDLKIEKHVHVAWYIPGDRWEESDTLFVNMLGTNAHVNVVVVLTRCDLRLQTDETTNLTALENTKQTITEAVPGVPIVECASPPKGSTYWVPNKCPRGHSKECFLISIRTGTWQCEGHENEECKERGKERTGSFGYTELVERTRQSIPELVRNSLLVAQVVDMKKKNRLAAAAIAAHTVSAMGLGAAAVPFSDYPFLLGLEATMAASLFHIYDVDPTIVSPETWLKLNVIVLSGVGIVGSVVAKLLKATAIFGVVGAGVDAAIAGALVATLGCSLAVVCEGLPPRSGIENMDKKEFAERLSKMVNSVKLIGFDLILNEARTAIGLGDKSGGGLLESLVSVMKQASDNIGDMIKDVTI